MQSKLMSLAEALAPLADGATVALGGNTLHRAPCAAAHELIRQGKRRLNLVKTAGAYDIDLLCGTGVADTVTAGFVGFENVFGMAPLYRRGVESGQVRAREHACYSVIAGLRAATQGVPFMPVVGLLESDVRRAQGFLTVADPYSGQEVVAIQAIVPDLAIVHVQEADALGNARIQGTLFEDLLMITAARRVVLTAERIVDGAAFAERPELTTIAGFLVDAVVHAPRGAWPCSCAGLYDYDADFLAAYIEATRTPEAFGQFVEQHLVGPRPLAAAAALVERADPIGSIS
jgi:glutaconate CoA-transferase, subunit A